MNISYVYVVHSSSQVTFYSIYCKDRLIGYKGSNSWSHVCCIHVIQPPFYSQISILQCCVSLTPFTPYISSQHEALYRPTRSDVQALKECAILSANYNTLQTWKWLCNNRLGSVIEWEVKSILCVLLLLLPKDLNYRANHPLAYLKCVSKKNNVEIWISLS